MITLPHADKIWMANLYDAFVGRNGGKCSFFLERAQDPEFC